MQIRRFLSSLTLAFATGLLTVLASCVDEPSSPAAASVASELRAKGGQSCEVDCDCPYGQVCAGTTCQIDFGPFPDCRCDDECDLGESCEEGICQETPQCAVDCDCGTGLVCYEGSCYLDFGPHLPCP